MILETDRLIVREFQEDDINLMMEYSQESGKRSELPDEVFETVAEAESYLRMCRENYDAGEYPLVYAIVLKESNRLIGDIQLCPFQIGIEISYSVAVHFQGNGYAAEAIGPFVRWAKENLQLSVIYGFVKKSNIASWRSLEKSGFVLSHEKEIVYYGKKFMFRVYKVSFVS